jgi:hypothetical protein
MTSIFISLKKYHSAFIYAKSPVAQENVRETAGNEQNIIEPVLYPNRVGKTADFLVFICTI